jgi:hypothetical protein
MSNKLRQQQGGAGIVFVIVLAIIGAGVFFALQYVPQYIEAGSVDSILSDLEKTHDEIPFKSTQEIKKRIERQLDVNDMGYLKEVVSVFQDGDEYVITVEYERELNLLYEKKPMPYKKTLVLR